MKAWYLVKKKHKNTLLTLTAKMEVRFPGATIIFPEATKTSDTYALCVVEGESVTADSAKFFAYGKRDVIIAYGVFPDNHQIVVAIHEYSQLKRINEAPIYRESMKKIVAELKNKASIYVLNGEFTIVSHDIDPVIHKSVMQVINTTSTAVRFIH